MEFKELERELKATWERYAAKHEVVLSEEYAVMKLGEEYGEFVQAYLILKGQSRKSKVKPEPEMKDDLAIELSDVIGTAFLTAHLLHIDLEDALRRKWIKTD